MAKGIISSFKFLSDALRAIGFILLLIFGLAVFMLRLPAGFDAWPILMIFFVLIVGLGALGFRFTSQIIGAQLVIGAIFAGATLLLPKTVTSLGALGQSMDTWVRRTLPEPEELKMSLSVLQGEDADAPATVYSWGS